MRRFNLMASLLVLGCASWSFGQGMGGGGGGFGSTGGGGGFGGSSGGFGSSSGGFGSGSGGSFSGGFGSGSGGSFSGGFGSGSGGSFSGGFGGTGAGGAGRGAGSGQYGTTSLFGKYYGNPYAAGAPSRTATATNNYVRTFPVPLSFGQPVFDSASVTRTGNLGTSSLGGLGGLGQSGGLRTGTTGANSAFAGASSAGIRRAPGYLTEPVFDMPERAAVEARRGNLQEVITRSSRLPSRENIQVTTDGEAVVLRGQVRNERERRLAEAVLRLSPGVREIRNELRVPSPQP
ncbi:MAG: BON domain-containing protein [Gemmataceae bacterium]